MIGISFLRFIISALLLYELCFVLVTCQDPCSNLYRQSNMSYCLYQTEEMIINKGAVWFGSRFMDNCPNGSSEWNINCYYPGFDQNKLTMSSRLFPPGTFEHSKLEQFLTITYHLQPGKYYGCRMTVNKTEHLDLDIYPGMEGISPWEARNQPSFNMTTSSSEKYTLIMVDVAFNHLHWLLINYPSSNTNESEIIPYIPPTNFRFISNPFAFLLFRQETPHLEILPKWQDFFRNINNLQKFNVIEFCKDHGLADVVAINWVSVSTDVSISETMKDFVNNCPLFLNNAIKQKNAIFLPKEPKLSIWMDINYNSFPLNLEICHQKCNYEIRNFYLSPLENMEVEPAVVITVPMVTLHMGKINPHGLEDFKGMYHTLLMVDPDVSDPTVGSPTRPLAHWLIINIPNGNPMAGKQLFSYKGPHPMTPKHTYYFLLYKQPGLITDDKKFQNLGVQCAHFQDARCQFDIQNFVRDNDFELVSASWMIASTDAYVLHSKVANSSMNEVDVCHERPLYPNCTLVSHGDALQKSEVLFFIAFIIICLRY